MTDQTREAFEAWLLSPEAATLVEPRCPVCDRRPEFSFDARVNEWSGHCKYCGIEGSRATTEAESVKKWIAWHHKPKAATLVEPLTCIWTEQDDDDMPETYASACGEMWSFTDGGVSENNVRFCQGCGKKVVVAIRQPLPTGTEQEKS
jgi:hypothetical protein